MKRIISFFICLIILISFSSCNADNNATSSSCNTDNNATSLRSGNYYAVGDYEEMLTPYLWLDTDQKTFSFGAGAVISYEEHGTYAVVGETIIATSQSITFQFEIVDKNTLILIDNGDDEFFKIPLNTQFVFSEVLK